MEKQLIGILIQLEALRTERAGMQAENEVRAHKGQHPAYDQAAFEPLCAQLDRLLNELLSS